MDVLLFTKNAWPVFNNTAFVKNAKQSSVGKLYKTCLGNGSKTTARYFKLYNHFVQHNYCWNICFFSCGFCLRQVALPWKAEILLGGACHNDDSFFHHHDSTVYYLCKNRL